MDGPILSVYGLKMSIIQGAVVGGVVAYILGQGPSITARIVKAMGGILFSIFATEGFLELASKWITITPAVDRLGGLVFGLTGLIIADSIVKTFSHVGEHAPEIIEKKIDQLGG